MKSILATLLILIFSGLAATAQNNENLPPEGECLTNKCKITSFVPIELGFTNISVGSATTMCLSQLLLVRASASPEYTPGTNVSVWEWFPESTNCPPTRYTNTLHPLMLDSGWTVSHQGYSGSGSGLYVEFLPTNCGTGTVSFFYTWTIWDHCINEPSEDHITTEYLTTNFVVHNVEIAEPYKIAFTNEEVAFTLTNTCGEVFWEALPSEPGGPQVSGSSIVTGTNCGTWFVRALNVAETNCMDSSQLHVICPEWITGVTNVDSAPGKILFVNKGDKDFDGIPNYGDYESTNYSGFGSVVPISLHIPSFPGRENAHVRFTYPAAPPGGTNINGKFRLWKHFGMDVRNPQPVPDGDYFATGKSYSMEELGVTYWGHAQVGFLVEALQPSTSSGDIELVLEIDVDGNEGPEGFKRAATARFTALDVDLVEAVDEGSTQKRDEFKDSEPSPIITVNNCAVSNVRPNADGTAILADVTISGNVKASICDITSGESGVITNVFIHLNSYEEPLDLDGVPLEVSKSTNLTSFTKPFPFSGSFTKTYPGVQVDSGTNLVRLTATDSVIGQTGFAEWTFTVTATNLLELTVDYSLITYSTIEATLNFGGIHSLQDLTPTNAVTLAINALVSTNTSFSETLYRVSPANQSPVLLAGATAWVVIEDANQLDSALQAGTQGEITAAISAPSMLPGATQFTLRETAAASSVFGHDRIAAELSLTAVPNPNVTDTMTVALDRSGYTGLTNLLTETAPDSLVFENGDGSVQVQLADGNFASTNVDFASATVTSTALGMSAHSLGSWETGTNTLVFVHGEPLQFYFSSSVSYGWNFGWDFDLTQPQQIAKSEGGELHLHFLQFQGPADVLAMLAAEPDTAVIQGADGRYYLKRADEERPVDYASMASPEGNGFEPGGGSGVFLLGFTKGFGAGGIKMIKGTANTIVAVEEWFLNLTIGTHQQQVAAYNDWVSFKHQTTESVKTLANFVQQVANDQAYTIASMVHGQL